MSGTERKYLGELLDPEQIIEMLGLNKVPYEEAESLVHGLFLDGRISREFGASVLEKLEGEGVELSDSNF